MYFVLSCKIQRISRQFFFCFAIPNIFFKRKLDHEFFVLSCHCSCLCLNSKCLDYFIHISGCSSIVSYPCLIFLLFFFFFLLEAIGIHSPHLYSECQCCRTSWTFWDAPDLPQRSWPLNLDGRGSAPRLLYHYRNMPVKNSRWDHGLGKLCRLFQAFTSTLYMCEQLTNELLAKALLRRVSVPNILSAETSGGEKRN